MNLLGVGAKHPEKLTFCFKMLPLRMLRLYPTHILRGLQGTNDFSQMGNAEEWASEIVVTATIHNPDAPPIGERLCGRKEFNYAKLFGFGEDMIFNYTQLNRGFSGLSRNKTTLYKFLSAFTPGRDGSTLGQI